MKTKLTLLVIILFLSLQASTQIVNIPDYHFKQLLLYRYDTNNDNEIQVSEAEAVTEKIEVYGDPFVWGEITDLTGIEAFVNSIGLNCKYNLITSLNLSQNLAFQTIDCSYNELTSINLGANTNLTELYCFKNNLPSLNVSHNTALEILRCYENNISSIDISLNINLIRISIGDNNLSSLDVSQNTVIERIGCSDNSIENIDLSNNSMLKSLGIGDNPLTSIDLSQNNLLESIYISNTQITDIDLSQNPQLYHLVITNTQITTLDVSNNPLLEYFKCSNNQISNINLTNNELLKAVICNDNSLVSLDIRNGNNANTTYFNSKNNPNLRCIFVDDSTYSNNHWIKDETSYFVENETQCATASVGDYDLTGIELYPNPVQHTLTITTQTNPEYINITIYSLPGEKMYYTFSNNTKNILINVADYPAGIYFIDIKTDTYNTIKKFIKQ